MVIMDRLSDEFITIGENSRIAPTVLFLKAERDQLDNKIIIGKNVAIRDGTIIYAGVVIADNVTIDHYCILRENTHIGRDTRIMNYTEINRDVTIGEKCRIAGYLANRVRIGDETSSFGHLVHIYPEHGEGKIETSPSLGNNVIVGRLALIAGNIHIADGQRVKAGNIVAPNNFKQEKKG